MNTPAYVQGRDAALGKYASSGFGGLLGGAFSPVGAAMGALIGNASSDEAQSPGSSALGAGLGSVAGTALGGMGGLGLAHALDKLLPPARASGRVRPVPFGMLGQPSTKRALTLLMLGSSLGSMLGGGGGALLGHKLHNKVLNKKDGERK